MSRAFWCLVLALFAVGCSEAGETEPAPTVTSEATTTVTPTTTAAPTTSTSVASSTTATTSTSVPVTEPPIVEPDPGGEPRLSISQITFGDAPYMTISNTGTGVGNTAGLWLCQFPDYWGLPDVDLAPGDALGVALGAAPVPDLIGITHRVSAGGALGTIDVTNGELALYRARSFDDPDQISDYVQWGTPGHARSTVATLAGIWPEDGFVAIPANSLAISAGGFPTTGPENWAAEVGN